MLSPVSDVRIALVSEGPTDRIVLEAAISAILEPQTFVLHQLQPEGSIAFGETGAGWGGVYRWCKQSAARGAGRVSNDRMVFHAFDLLIIHVDIDVATGSYPQARIDASHTDGILPCDLPCPPASATADQLRRVVLSWCGENHLPGCLVVCLPSRNMDAWVLASVFPDQRSGHLECLADPADWMRQRPLRSRVKKSQSAYRELADRMAGEWADVVVHLPQAATFQTELEMAVSACFQIQPVATGNTAATTPASNR